MPCLARQVGIARGRSLIGQPPEQIDLIGCLQLRLRVILDLRRSERADRARMTGRARSFDIGQELRRDRPEIALRLAHPPGGDRDIAVVGERAFDQRRQHRIAEALPPGAIDRAGRRVISPPGRGRHHGWHRDRPDLVAEAPG